jgi:Uma2 family endonuclease
MARVPTQSMTAEKFFDLVVPDGRAELVRGEVVPMSFPGFEHGVIAARVTARLLGFVEANALGFVTAETGFILERDPDTVRGPDVAFVSLARLGGQALPKKFWPSAPDLAVEVISPSQRPKGVREKVRSWFAAGVRQVWLLYPSTRTVYVLRSPTDAQILGPDDTLLGGELLPGFSCPVAAFFQVGESGPGR